jgi:hypothetical protein
METPIIVAIVGILGVVAGATLQASLQFFFGRRIEMSKQFKLLQTQAYVDFVKGWAGMGRAQFFEDKEKEIEYTILTAETRARISIYGSQRVVKKLAEFFREHNETVSEQGGKAFAELISIMREESISINDLVTKDEINITLHGGKPKEKELKKV